MIFFDISKDIEQIKKSRKEKLFSDLDQETVSEFLASSKEVKQDAELLNEAINQGIVSLNPDIIFANITSNLKMAENIYGEKMIRLVSGYDENYIKRNINIPEFRKELKNKIEENIEKLKEKKFLTEEGIISEKALKLVTLYLYMTEMEQLKARGLGKKLLKKYYVYGEKTSTKVFTKRDRYRDIAIRKSIKIALRRQHKAIMLEDLISFERKRPYQHNIIYAIDASGSMKGEKIDKAKKAGIALAYNAIKEKDKVGLIIFSKEVKKEIPASYNFELIAKEIASIKTGSQTNFVKTIETAIKLFKGKEGKHLIFITDALPTLPEKPEEETLKAVSLARENKISISIVGINLDKKGRELAKKIVSIANGRLFITKHVQDVDKLVLIDYYYLK